MIFETKTFLIDPDDCVVSKSLDQNDVHWSGEQNNSYVQ